MALNYYYNKIIKYVIKAECREPLHIGSAEGSSEEVLVHPVDRVPLSRHPVSPGCSEAITSRLMEIMVQEIFLETENLQKAQTHQKREVKYVFQMVVLKIRGEI